MLSNKKLNPIVTEFLEVDYSKFFFFYYAILFCLPKKYLTKFYALFYYENFNK